MSRYCPADMLIVWKLEFLFNSSFCISLCLETCKTTFKSYWIYSFGNLLIKIAGLMGMIWDPFCRMLLFFMFSSTFDFIPFSWLHFPMLSSNTLWSQHLWMYFSWEQDYDAVILSLWLQEQLPASLINYELISSEPFCASVNRSLWLYPVNLEKMFLSLLILPQTTIGIT